MKKTRFGVSGVFLVLCLTVLGCGGSGGKKLYPVEGTVTLDNEPLEGATVTFVGQEGAIASGVSTASGKFKLITTGQEGAPAGTYKVTVTKTENKAKDIADQNRNDPTKAYTETMKQSGTKVGAKGVEAAKTKSEIPERYAKNGSLPDVVVPVSGSVPIELKSK